MEKCEKCGMYREFLKDGVCVFCLHGHGGKTIEKESTQSSLGKAVKSALVDVS